MGQKSPPPSSIVKFYWHFFISWPTDFIKKNNKGVCRTVPATPCVLSMNLNYTLQDFAHTKGSMWFKKSNLPFFAPKFECYNSI